jgi:hypothetical protein
MFPSDTEKIRLLTSRARERERLFKKPRRDLSIGDQGYLLCERCFHLNGALGVFTHRALNGKPSA